MSLPGPVMQAGPVTQTQGHLTTKKRSMRNGSDQHGARRAPNKVLLVSFFVLGMGLFAPAASLWQSMDYLNVQYAAYHPSRLLSTGYNVMYMVFVFGLFAWGAQLWPSKQGRMLTGFLLYVAALAVPPAVDEVMLVLMGINTETALQAAFACWGVAAAVAGAADAMISSVVYAEAAATGAAYTHAFLGGKAASGVVMAALRVISKAVMPPTTAGLQHSTGIYSAAAALLVLVCVANVAVVLPRMRQELEQLKAHAGVTVEQTLQEIDQALAEAQAAATGNKHSRPRCKGTLATCSTTAAASLESAGSGHLPSSKQQLRCLSSRSYPPHAPSSFSHSSSHRRPATQGVSQAGGGMRPPGHYSLPAVMQSVLARPSMVCDTAHSQQQQWEQWERVLPSSTASAAAAASGGAVPGADAASSSSDWVLHVPTDQQPKHHSCHSTQGCDGRSSSSSSSSSGGTTATADGDSDGRSSSCGCSSMCCMDIETGQLEGPGTGSTTSSTSSITSSSSSGDSPKAFVVLGSLKAPLPPSSPNAKLGANSVQGDGAADGFLRDQQTQKAAAAPGPQQQQQQQKQRLVETSSASLTAEGAPGRSRVLQAMQLIYPYQIAAFIPPLVTATILPMIFSSQVGVSPALGSWYTQLLVVAIQLGGFIGSALIPVRHLKYPRTSLLSASCAMVLFIGAFALALKQGLFAAGFIPLAFVMQTYSGLLTTCVFCLAPSGLLRQDAELVQQLLVLTTAVSFAGGSGISWAWLAAGAMGSGPTAMKGMGM